MLEKNRSAKRQEIVLLSRGVLGRVRVLTAGFLVCGEHKLTGLALREVALAPHRCNVLPHILEFSFGKNAAMHVSPDVVHIWLCDWQMQNI